MVFRVFGGGDGKPERGGLDDDGEPRKGAQNLLTALALRSVPVGRESGRRAATLSERKQPPGDRRGRSRRAFS